MTFSVTKQDKYELQITGVHSVAELHKYEKQKLKTNIK
jgi:hypothetical protein